MVDFSIIVPSFNKGNFIAETIESVIKQNYFNWELLIVEDGSTDNSVEIIEELCAKDHRINLIKRDCLPKGGSACRNIGIDHAQGRYVMFLDADDLIEFNSIKNRLLNINFNPTADFWVFPVGTFYKNIGDSSSIWIPKGKNFLQKFLRHDLPWNIMSVVWTKKLLQELGGFDVNYPRLQDVELHTRALFKEDVNYKVYPKEKPNCFYRIDESRTNQNPFNFLEGWTQGVILFTDKSEKLISESNYNKNKLRKELRGTPFSMLTTLLNRRANGVLNDKDYTALKSLLLEHPAIKRIFNKRSFQVVWLYESAYKAGSYRVKGFNYLFRKLILK